MTELQETWRKMEQLREEAAITLAYAVLKTLREAGSTHAYRPISEHDKLVELLKETYIQ